MIQTNLRDALRVQTRTDHDQLDRMVTTLDIAKLADFILFLQVFAATSSLLYRDQIAGRGTWAFKENIVLYD